MTKYKGAIVDQDGFIIFEFITRFCRGGTEAQQRATEILEAWRSTHPDEKFFYTLDD
jgi:hypothetical protein